MQEELTDMTTNIPQPVLKNNFDEDIEWLKKELSICLGIPKEFLGYGSKGESATYTNRSIKENN